MRGVLCAAVFSFSALVSCDTQYYAVTVKNNSAKTVSYTYNGGSRSSLVPGGEKTYQVTAFTPPPADVSVDQGALSVRMEQGREGFVFDNAAWLSLEVTNTLSVPVTIKAGEYIEKSAGPNTTALTIEADTTVNTGIVIYTRNPVFTAISGHPVMFAWSIIEAEGAEKMAVIIR
ncbi:MAG: hypothetical protein LBC88_10225 [Spirochaetaceae bacterium]|nr:hypothetical protein [Spirochaetaceae bacterium]